MAMLAQPDPPYDWLQAESVVVAPLLLGWKLSTLIDGQITAGRIVEVEAYAGARDPASHAYRGPRPRNLAMFKGAGHIYAYRSYGIHICMNIVTGPVGAGQAVLIRALEPTAGQDIMAARRGLTDPRLLTSGPGRLTQALGVTLAHNGAVLGGGFISLSPPAKPITPGLIVAGPLIGISQAKDYPWRFYLAGNRFVSRS
jgi:DNA-3-methyladenine glycosylase